MWFKNLTGFEEGSPENVRRHLRIEGDSFVSTVNQRKMAFGRLEIATLADLRQHHAALVAYDGALRLSEIVGNVRYLHTLPHNANALFQAASQFNLLEMVEPGVRPEQGIDRYELDHTQGPACAIACGAGTIYRNYFVEMGDQLGQTAHKQIDCLELVGQYLQDDERPLWTMKNGYALIPKASLLAINEKLQAMSAEEREDLKGKLKVGIQWNTEVTIAEQPHRVSQIYCSALPVAYNATAPLYWESFARIILEATYEATFYAALRNLQTTGSNLLYLTLVGGGVFGNDENWILESIQKVVHQFKNVPLDVKIVSYGSSNARLRAKMQLQ